MAAAIGIAGDEILDISSGIFYNAETEAENRGIGDKMSVLYLVRHGQASFGAENYDQLSKLGERQMSLLGQYWLKFGILPDAVYSGSLSRQQRSAECVAEAFRSAGRKFPEIKIIEQFNEYETRHILTASLSEVLTRNPEIARLARELAPNGAVDFVNDKKAFQKLFSAVMDMWVDDRIQVEGMESWKQFTSRVNQGLERVMEEQGAGKTVAVFTSGGPVSAVMQRALKTADKTALELGWVIANGSVSEFRYSGEKFSLAVFNATNHLTEPELITYR